VLVLASARKDLRRRLRARALIFLWVGAPLAILTLISVALGGSDEPNALEVLVVDRDRSGTSRTFVGALASATQIPLRFETALEEDARARMERGDATALLVLPEGFGQAVLFREPATLELVTNPNQQVGPIIAQEAVEIALEATFYFHRSTDAALRHVVRTLAADGPLGPDEPPISRIQPLLAQAEAFFERPPIELTLGRTEAEDDVWGATGYFLPSMLLLSLGLMAGGLAEDIWREKALGTLRRAVSGPTGVVPLLAGKTLAGFLLFCTVGFAVLLLARFALGVEVEHLGWAVVWMALTGTLFLLLLTGLQMLASNQRTAAQLSNAGLLPLLMLGGGFFPLELMPDWLARLGRVTPPGWALVRLKELLRGELDPQALALTGAAVLLLCGVLFALIARRAQASFARTV